MTATTLAPAASRRITGEDDILTARLIPEGRFNACWHVTGETNSYLIKLNDREGIEHLRKTADAMKNAAAHGVAVPRVLRLGTDPDVGPYLLQEWLPGRTLAEAQQTERVPSNLWPALAEQIARLHDTPANDAPTTPASRRGELVDLLQRLDRDRLIPADLAQAARHRGALLADQLGDHPIVNTHQDLHPDNILIRPDGQVVLLDFDHAARAEDASDFVKIDRWCRLTDTERRQLFDTYWNRRAHPADPLFEQRLAFYRLIIYLSYVLYWHGRDTSQIPEAVTALRNELE
jgi:aminoglycoside phosphotransferase (APT) family kinase protein